MLLSASSRGAIRVSVSGGREVMCFSSLSHGGCCSAIVVSIAADRVNLRTDLISAGTRPHRKWAEVDIRIGP
jgi:hypothetical protein